MPRTVEPDWKMWLEKWDRQQESYLPSREQRFEALFDVLEAALGRRFTVVDLGCGPGSLSLRLLRRFPRARSFGLDTDPVLMKIGREAVGTLHGRMHWIEADLRHPDWRRRLPVRRVDAAVSTTALHWLAPPQLRRMYRELFQLLPPRGLVLNGDYLPSDAEGPTIQHLFHRVARTRVKRRGPRPLWLDWVGWWRLLEREPSLAPLFQVRRKRFPRRHPRETHLSLEDHAKALRRAGFGEIGVARQELNDRLLVAVK